MLLGYFFKQLIAYTFELTPKQVKIYTCFCFEATAGVFHLCAERAAAFNMFQNSGQTKIKRIITFRNHAPIDGDSMPCGACLDFLLQLNNENCHAQIMFDFKSRKSVMLVDLLPHWWGTQRPMNQ